MSYLACIGDATQKQTEVHISQNSDNGQLHVSYVSTSKSQQ